MGLTYFSYNNKSWLFEPYNPENNPNIVSKGKFGLQYINLPIDPNEELSSSDISKRDNMLNQALSELKYNGIKNSYIKTTTDQYNMKIFLILVLIFILTIVSFVTYMTVR